MHKAYLQNLPPTASYGCLATKRKPFAYAGKGLYTKENSQNYSKTHSIIFAYNQLLVVWNSCAPLRLPVVSVQLSGRSPGLKIIASAIFPVSQWYLGLCSLITVTSSYRICTCFPFHRNQSFVSSILIVPTPDCYIFNWSYSSTLPSTVQYRKKISAFIFLYKYKYIYYFTDAVFSWHIHFPEA